MASAAKASGVLTQWLELQHDRVAEAACKSLANSEEGEEFATNWDEAQQNLAKGAVASVDNLV